MLVHLLVVLETHQPRCRECGSTRLGRTVAAVHFIVHAWWYNNEWRIAIVSISKIQLLLW